MEEHIEELNKLIIDMEEDLKFMYGQVSKAKLLTTRIHKKIENEPEIIIYSGYTKSFHKVVEDIVNNCHTHGEFCNRFNRKSNLNSKYFTFKSLPFNAISGFTEDAKRYFDDAPYEIDGINELELKTPDQI